MDGKYIHFRLLQNFENIFSSIKVCDFVTVDSEELKDMRVHLISLLVSGQYRRKTFFFAVYNSLAFFNRLNSPTFGEKFDFHSLF